MERMTDEEKVCIGIYWRIQSILLRLALRFVRAVFMIVPGSSYGAAELRSAKIFSPTVRLW